MQGWLPITPRIISRPLIIAYSPHQHMAVIAHGLCPQHPPHSLTHSHSSALHSLRFLIQAQAQTEAFPTSLPIAGAWWYCFWNGRFYNQFSGSGPAVLTFYFELQIQRRLQKTCREVLWASPSVNILHAIVVSVPRDWYRYSPQHIQRSCFVCTHLCVRHTILSYT